MNTNANLFIVPIQDILSLDDTCRLNTPGTIKNNWKWKLNQPLEEIEENMRFLASWGMILGELGIRNLWTLFFNKFIFNILNLNNFYI